MDTEHGIKTSAKHAIHLKDAFTFCDRHSFTHSILRNEWMPIMKIQFSKIESERFCNILKNHLVESSEILKVWAYFCLDFRIAFRSLSHLFGAIALHFQMILSSNYSKSYSIYTVFVEYHSTHSAHCKQFKMMIAHFSKEFYAVQNASNKWCN